MHVQKKNSFYCKKSAKYKSTNDDLNIAVILSSTYLKAQGIYGQFSSPKSEQFQPKLCFLNFTNNGERFVKTFLSAKVKFLIN